MLTSKKYCGIITKLTDELRKSSKELENKRKKFLTNSQTNDIIYKLSQTSGMQNLDN